DDGDVHPLLSLDLVQINLRKNCLVSHPQRVVSLAIKGANRQTPEVADARERGRYQPIEEFVHGLAAQGHMASNRLSLTELEIGDALAGLSHDRFAPSNQAHVLGRIIDSPLFQGSAHPHVENDLFDFGDLMNVAVLSPLHQGGPNGLKIALKKS